jgi:hypothetical protein
MKKEKSLILDKRTQLESEDCNRKHLKGISSKRRDFTSFSEPELDWILETRDLRDDQT